MRVSSPACDLRQLRFWWVDGPCRRKRTDSSSVRVVRLLERGRPCHRKRFIGDTEIEPLSTNLPILAEDAAHATLGASTAARWMACPGSINLIETLPDYDPEKSGSNIAAREGKCAHQVAERALQCDRCTAGDYIGQTYHDVEVTEEMAQHVQLYLDHVRKVQSIPGVLWWVEKKFSLAALNPPPSRPMFGTSDFSAYDPASRTLYVDDL